MLQIKLFILNNLRETRKEKDTNKNGLMVIVTSLKRELNSIGKKLKQHPGNFGLRTSFHRMRKEYKKLLKETKQKFIKAIVEKLDSLHEDDPKSFWKTIDNLRKGVQIQDNPISLSS